MEFKDSIEALHSIDRILGRKKSPRVIVKVSGENGVSLKVPAELLQLLQRVRNFSIKANRVECTVSNSLEFASVRVDFERWMREVLERGGQVEVTELQS